MAENIEIDYLEYPFEVKIRHHVTSQMYFKLEDLVNPTELYPPLMDKMDWSQCFANGKKPEILDIGCGKGIFLLSLANNNPEKNYLGIELRRYPVEWINSVVKGKNLGNCFALNYSVVNGLEFIESNSIEQIFYLFPDPWPKRKQQIRRAFNNDFLKMCDEIMVDGGRLYLATDCDYVDNYHRKLLTEYKKFDFKRPETNEWDFPLTNKERFCVEKNINIYRWICTKK